MMSILHCVQFANGLPVTLNGRIHGEPDISVRRTFIENAIMTAVTTAWANVYTNIGFMHRFVFEFEAQTTRNRKTDKLVGDVARDAASFAA